MIPEGSKEILEGCSNCKGRFFFFIKQEQIDKLKLEEPIEMAGMDKKKIETQVRDMVGVEEEEIPIILDLESVKVTGPGKFEIDVVNLFNKRRPLVYKLEEGKYIIDLASTLKVDLGGE